MQRGLSSIEQNLLKICIRDRRKRDEHQIHNRDKKGNFSTKFSSYGKLIEYTYPLLNPDLNKEMMISKHETWFKDLSPSSVFLTENINDNEDFCAYTVEELGLKAPCIL